MLLSDSDFNAKEFISFVTSLPKQGGYDSDFENFEEGTVYLNDTDYIVPDDIPLENQVDDDGKYQNVESVYKYVDKFGEEVYIKHSYIRSGSYFSEYHYQDYELNVVMPHVETIVKYY